MRLMDAANVTAHLAEALVIFKMGGTFDTVTKDWAISTNVMTTEYKQNIV